MDHYDLLAREGWSAKSMLIVSPFVEKAFFETLAEKIKPKALTVVIDDSCRSSDIEMIKKIQNQTKNLNVVLAGCSGLVHAKIFYVEWITSAKRSAYTLVYGSGNATRQAFEGVVNSELMCKVRLTAANHGPILDWLNNVVAKANSLAQSQNAVRNNKKSATIEKVDLAPLRDAEVAKGVHLRLPGMSLKHATSKADGFDSWLQRGHLLSKYDPDNAFLKIGIDLKKELPKGALESAVRRSGFDTQLSKKLNYSYIAVSKKDADGSKKESWRSKYFVWTHLGYWCSDECYKNHNNQFKNSGYKARKATIDKLKLLEVEAEINKECSIFIEKMRELWSSLGTTARDYLYEIDNGLHEAKYKEIFDKKIKIDFEKIADEDFCERYVTGYENIELPRFRVDAKAWNSFVLSFLDQVRFEGNAKKRSNSLIYGHFFHVVEDTDFETSQKMLKFLKQNWNSATEDGQTIGEYIVSYHDNP